MKISVAKLAVELRVVCAAAVAQMCHAEVDDQVANASCMVEIMSNFNISTLMAPAGSYFELSLDYMTNIAEEAGEMFHCPVMSNQLIGVSSARIDIIVKLVNNKFPSSTDF